MDAGDAGDEGPRTETLNTKLPSTWHLRETPWFDEEDGLLVLDPELGPVADVHTHLALTYGRRNALNLDAAARPTEHYLPMGLPYDLCCYGNQNFDKASMEAMRRDLGLGAIGGGGGGGMRATHTAANLCKEAAALRIERSVILPIDLPVLSWNADAYLGVAKKYDGLLSGGSVHPARRGLTAEVKRQVDAGARCIKVHPAVQQIRPDHPRAMKLYQACGEVGVPVFWHCGPVGIVSKRADQRCQLKHYWPAIDQNPQTTFVLGHSGALQVREAIHLARSYDNVYLDLACQGLTAVRQILAAVSPERVMNGSDWPFYPQAPSIAKVLYATEGAPGARRQVLWETSHRLYPAA